jgi:sugar lactone lactonase YvrE
MKKRTIGWIGAAILVAAVATAWGLMVSVGVSEDAIVRSELPDAGFDRDIGRATTAVAAAWGKGLGKVGISTEGEAKGPNALGVDDRGRVYLLDQVNERVVRYAEGRPDAAVRLPDQYFDDLLVARDQVVVLRRDGDRLALVLDTHRGTVETLPIDADVPPIYRLALAGDEVRVECPEADDHPTHAIGTLTGGRASKERQLTELPAFPTPAGLTVKGARTDRNNVRLDLADSAGRQRYKLRIHSARDIGAVTMVMGDRTGNIYVAYTVVSGSADPDKERTRQVVARYSPDGELTGRVETANDTFPIPHRQWCLSEAGDLYQLTANEDGIAVLEWTLE